MEANKTLEQEIIDILDTHTILSDKPHFETGQAVEKLAIFIRSQQKGPKWVKAWERLPELTKSVYLKATEKDKEYKAAGYFFTWIGAKPGETQLYCEWSPIVSKDYERLQIYWWDESPTEPVNAEKLWKSIMHRIHWHDADIEVVFKGDFIKLFNPYSHE